MGIERNGRDDEGGNPPPPHHETERGVEFQRRQHIKDALRNADRVEVAASGRQKEQRDEGGIARQPRRINKMAAVEDGAGLAEIGGGVGVYSRVRRVGVIEDRHQRGQRQRHSTPGEIARAAPVARHPLHHVLYSWIAHQAGVHSPPQVSSFSVHSMPQSLAFRGRPCAISVPGHKKRPPIKVMRGQIVVVTPNLTPRPPLP